MCHHTYPAKFLNISQLSNVEEKPHNHELLNSFNTSNTFLFNNSVFTDNENSLFAFSTIDTFLYLKDIGTYNYYATLTLKY